MMLRTFANKCSLEIARTIILAVGGSLRIRRYTAPRPSGSVIYAFFHGMQFALVYSFRNTETAILTSLSQDGDFQDMLLRNLGFRTVRGSSTRGGAAGLIGLRRELRNGYNAAFAVDGAARGPRWSVKPGAIYLAARTGLPIIPLAVSYKSCHIFRKAWDHYRLPHPFSRVILLEAEPFYVEKDADLSISCCKLQRRLYQLHRQATDINASRGRLPKGYFADV